MEARELAEEGVELGLRLGHQGGEILSRRGVGLSWLFTDADLGKLERLARDDLERFDRIRSPWVSQSHAWIASVLLLRGELDGSLRHADEAIKLEPASAWSGIGWSFKFLNRSYAGDVDACRTLLAEQRDRLPRQGEATAWGRVAMLIAAAHGCVVADLRDEAAGLYLLVAERAERIPINVFDIALTNRVAGMAAAAAERWDVAADHFEAALRQADEMPNRLDRPQVLHWFAKMLVDRGRHEDVERAGDMIGAALSEYERLGMPLHIEMARALR